MTHVNVVRKCKWVKNWHSARQASGLVQGSESSPGPYSPQHCWLLGGCCWFDAVSDSNRNYVKRTICLCMAGTFFIQVTKNHLRQKHVWKSCCPLLARDLQKIKSTTIFNTWVVFEITNNIKCGGHLFRKWLFINSCRFIPHKQKILWILQSVFYLDQKLWKLPPNAG